MIEKRSYYETSPSEDYRKSARNHVWHDIKYGRCSCCFSVSRQRVSFWPLWSAFLFLSLLSGVFIFDKFDSICVYKYVYTWVRASFISNRFVLILSFLKWIIPISTLCVWNVSRNLSLVIKINDVVNINDSELNKINEL